ncbi:hypothetical protein V5N11_010715 [Cardamine amara subsp. amara]|uniref:Uncharacterized protein n=1 Tax=Cardamine amara subsp. amara TaxID=228776 RepID=A0ABD0ZMH4_CARAN
MSIMVTHSYMVRNVYAVPFQTSIGIGFHYYSAISELHVHKVVPLFHSKRFPHPQKVSVKPSKPSITVKSPSKPDLVLEKPIQTPSQEEEGFFEGSVTKGAAPSPRHVPIPSFCVSSKLTT